MIPCLVLNADLQPTAVVSAERGLVLVLKGEASVKEELPERRFHSVRETFPIPTCVVLKTWRHTGSGYHKAAQLNQRNLFTRDNYTCVYCRRHLLELNYEAARGPVEYLTRDHVRPLSRGGLDIWENVVTACASCNQLKDDYTAEELLEKVLECEERIERAKAEFAMPGPMKDLEAERAQWQRLLLPYPPRVATVYEILRKRQKKLEKRVEEMVA